MRAVRYRLVRVSFASFIFFPRPLFPFSPSFLLPSISNLSYSILSLFIYNSVAVMYFFSFSRLPIHCLPISELHIYAAWSHVLTRVSRKNSPRDSPISAPMSSQVAPSAVPLYSRGDFWIVVNILQSDSPRTILHAERDSFTPRVLSRTVSGMPWVCR